jgi:hypothetical protein
MNNQFQKCICPSKPFTGNGCIIFYERTCIKPVYRYCVCIKLLMHFLFSSTLVIALRIILIGQMVRQCADRQHLRLLFLYRKMDCFLKGLLSSIEIQLLSGWIAPKYGNDNKEGTLASSIMWKNFRIHLLQKQWFFQIFWCWIPFSFQSFL